MSAPVLSPVILTAAAVDVMRSAALPGQRMEEPVALSDGRFRVLLDRDCIDALERLGNPLIADQCARYSDVIVRAGSGNASGTVN